MTTYSGIFFEDASLYRVINVGLVLRFGVYPAVSNCDAFERNVADGGEESISCKKKTQQCKSCTMLESLTYTPKNGIHCPAKLSPAR